MVTQARDLGLELADEAIRLLIRDRDSKYSGTFDEVLRSGGVRVVKTPVRSPQANAIAERLVRTVRTQCLDWLLILNRRHLERVMRAASITTTSADRTARSSSSHRNLGSHRRQRPSPRSSAATAAAAHARALSNRRLTDTTIGTLHVTPAWDSRTR